MSSIQERRQHVRISQSLEVSYWASKQLLRFSSRSVDISRGGICLPVLQRLEAGTIIQLEIRSPEVRKPIVATAKVVWLKEKRNRQFPFEIGIKFIEITPSDSKVLDGLCKKLEDEHSADIRRVE